MKAPMERPENETRAIDTILAASRRLLARSQAKAKDWGGGIWRTTDDGEKIFIKDGEARGGGPAGPVLGGKKTKPTRKRTKPTAVNAKTETKPGKPDKYTEMASVKRREIDKSQAEAEARLQRLKAGKPEGVLETNDYARNPKKAIADARDQVEQIKKQPRELTDDDKKMADMMESMQNKKTASDSNAATKTEDQEAKPKKKPVETKPRKNNPTVDSLLPTPSKDAIDYVSKGQENWLAMHAKAYGTTPEKLKKEWTAKVKEMTAKAKVYIRMPPEVLDSVLNEGRYKSQFETNSSYGGDVQIDGRREFEKHQMGVPEDIPDNQRPVYGYASDQTPHMRAKVSPGQQVQRKSNHDGAGGYGRVVVEYKDSVKERSTITFGDSMNSAEETLPTPMNSPDYRSLAFGSWEGGKADSPKPPKEIEMGSVDGAVHGNRDYAEVQIHRGAAASDIAKVWFDRPPNEKTQGLLKKQGIEWEVMK